jgi:putative ABC transport system permease protein
LNLKLYLTLSWRNLWRNKRRTIITIASVFFAILLALAAESMNYGSHEKMIENIVHFQTGYIQIQEKNYSDEISLDNSIVYDEEFVDQFDTLKNKISYIIPRLESGALAATEEHSRAVMVLGSDFTKENQLNNIFEKIVQGRFFTENQDAAVISAGLAEYLNLTVGDTIVLIGQGFQAQSAAGKYHISGILQHNLPELNERMVYLPLSAAQWLYAADDRITSLLIMPEFIRERQVEQLVKDLNQQLDTSEYRVVLWKELVPEIVQALEFDKVSNKFLLLILYMVIGFGIFGVVLTMTLEREREYGMLVSIGMQRRKLVITTILETLWISIIGVITGVIAALPILYYFNKNPIPITGEAAEMVKDYGLEPILPFSLDPEFFYHHALIVFTLSMLIVIYPVLRIFFLNVVKATRSS